MKLLEQLGLCLQRYFSRVFYAFHRRDVASFQTNGTEASKWFEIGEYAAAIQGESAEEISESVWLLSTTTGNAGVLPLEICHITRHYVVDGVLTPLIRNTRR